MLASRWDLMSELANQLQLARRGKTTAHTLHMFVNQPLFHLSLDLAQLRA
jgi:hypothetical protein